MPQYEKNPPLLEKDLLRDPIAQFRRWLTTASAAGMIEPTAMTLATVDAAGNPHARMVLFKSIVQGGFCFFTNYGSAKGRQLAARQRAALVFWWDKLERQVRIEGRVEKLSRTQALRYFRSRPRVSQLSALVSQQSRVVKARAELDERYARQEQALDGRPVPLPATWGGYRVVPQAIEFWQGRRGRLHDRLQYRRRGKRWIVERLEP